jgi:hypothetical protein
LYPWNIVVFGGISWFLQAKIKEAFGHLIDEVLVDFLFAELSLFLL